MKQRLADRVVRRLGTWIGYLLVAGMCFVAFGIIAFIGETIWRAVL